MAGDALCIARDPNPGDSLLVAPVICALAKKHRKLYLAMNNDAVRQILDLPDNVVDALHSEPDFDSPRQMQTYVLGVGYGCGYMARPCTMHLTRHLAESVGVEVDDIRPRIKVPEMDVPAYDVVLAPWAAAESRTLTPEEAADLALSLQPLRVGLIGAYLDPRIGHLKHDLRETYEYGRDFDCVVNLMRRAKVVITVESFGGRLAAAVQPKHHILLSTPATPLFMQTYGGEVVVPFIAGYFNPLATVEAVQRALEDDNEVG